MTRKARSLWGYAGWVGDRVRDRAGRGREPPKRRRWGAQSYLQAAVSNYRGFYINTLRL
jgi:hypothetical protein